MNHLTTALLNYSDKLRKSVYEYISLTFKLLQLDPVVYVGIIMYIVTKKIVPYAEGDTRAISVYTKSYPHPD